MGAGGVTDDRRGPFYIAFLRLLGAFWLDAVDAVIALLVFMLADQQLFAREWILGGAEPKTFAYPLAILGVTEALHGRPYRALA